MDALCRFYPGITMTAQLAADCTGILVAEVNRIKRAGNLNVPFGPVCSLD